MTASAVLLLIVMALAGCAASTPKPESESAYRLVGYAGGGKAFPRIDAEKLTAINYAFAQVDAQGEVVLHGSADIDFLTRLRELKSRNPHLSVLISVGGWGADGFSDAAASDASRAKFAGSAAKIIAQNDLDGIDIDWEYPGLPGPGIGHRTEDKRNFTLLLESLRQRLDALAAQRGRRDAYLITAALADGEFVANIELDRVGAVLDWINLMTYDFHNSLTPTTGHHSAFARSANSPAAERTLEAAIDQYIAAGVPARKLVVGVPFYSRAFTEVNPDHHGIGQPYGKYFGSEPWPKLVADFIDRNGYVRYWDDAAKEPYLWNAQTRTFVSYDDPQSLTLKSAFVKTHGLGGMMYWEQSEDPGGELVEVLSRGLR